MGTYQIVFDMRNVARLDDDGFEWHLAARMVPRNGTYQGGYSELYGEGRIGYNVNSEDNGEIYLDSVPRLTANKTVAINGYTRPGQAVCVPIGEDFASMGLPPKTIEITIEADPSVMPLPNVTAIENDEINDFWEVRIPGYDPATSSQTYTSLEDEEVKYHYDAAGRMRFRLPRVEYDGGSDDPAGTQYPACVEVQVPGGEVFEDEDVAFPSSDGQYPYALGVFIDFTVTITGLEHYPVLYDFREDGEFGESEPINNVTIDEREIHNGEFSDREAIFFVHYERDLFNNLSVIVDNVQLGAGQGMNFVKHPPRNALQVRFRSVDRSTNVRPFQNDGFTRVQPFPGTHSRYGDLIDSYSESDSISGVNSIGTRSATIQPFGRPTSRTGMSEVGTYMISVTRGSTCDANYMQMSVRATHESVRGECIHNDDCVRNKDHPSEDRKDASDNNDEHRFTICADVPSYDSSMGQRVQPRTRCIECTNDVMCEDGQYC